MKFLVGGIQLTRLGSIQVLRGPWDILEAQQREIGGKTGRRDRARKKKLFKSRFEHDRVPITSYKQGLQYKHRRIKNVVEFA